MGFEESTNRVIVDRYNATLLAKKRLSISDESTSDEDITDGSKTSNSVIGFEYEIDENFKKPGFAEALEKYNIFDEYKQKGVPYAIYAGASDVFNMKEPGVNEILQKWLKIE